ncbi:hypothetical protein T492DRAFT_898941 [Pavlovales sp. CCMP2436]|nr:hypothetical protein T492DRAFT_898941 [Pavlovales sp. CCMP2436]
MAHRTGQFVQLLLLAGGSASGVGPGARAGPRLPIPPAASGSRPLDWNLTVAISEFFTDACTRHGKVPPLRDRNLPLGLLAHTDDRIPYPIAVAAPFLFEMDVLFNRSGALCPGADSYLGLDEAPEADESTAYWNNVRISYFDGRSGQLKLTPAKVAEYIGAPLLCTIPVTTGVLSPRRWVGSAPHRSSRPLLLTFEGTPRQHDAAVARLAAYNQLLAHGARCGGNKNGSCAICSPGAACEPGGGMFKVIANARFCVEPPGDSQLRSHLTIAVLFGCVPVIFDYSHAKYKRSGVSWWPWRMPPAKHSILSTPGAGGLDYSKFAYVVSPVALATGSWVADVLAAATDGRWEMMRAALDEAAPLFAYSRTPCAGGVCDAFSALQDVIRRSRQLRNALLPSLDGK